MSTCLMLPLASVSTIFFFLQTQFSEEQFSGSLLSGSSLCIGPIAITGPFCVISDRFPVEHVHTPGRQTFPTVWDSFIVSSGVYEDFLEISDRFPEEQVQIPGGQTSFSARGGQSGKTADWLLISRVLALSADRSKAAQVN